MSTMAEVIERFLSANYPCACEGDCPGEHAEAEELADALAKAGYGKLADARAAELEAAADDMARLTEVGRKPYAACSEDELADYYPYVQRDSKEHWLRARATAIRAGEA